MRFATVAAIVIVLSGCTRTIDSQPITQPQKVDCDLIFPGPGGA